MTRGGVMIGALALGLAIGCSESTGPRISSSAIRVVPLVPLYGVGVRDTDVANPPAVRITYFSSGKVISGKPVVFTVDSDDGARTNVTILTDADGVAKLPGWRLGRNLGRHAVTAVTEGWAPITFIVMVPGDVMAIYNLKSLNGMPNDSRVSEAHIVLYEIGLHNYFFRRPAEGFTEAPELLGAYKPLGVDGIDFSTQCSFVPAVCAARRMTATVRGTELIVDESDPFFGPWVEVYGLSTGVVVGSAGFGLRDELPSLTNVEPQVPMIRSWLQ